MKKLGYELERVSRAEDAVSAVVQVERYGPAGALETEEPARRSVSSQARGAQVLESDPVQAGLAGVDPVRGRRPGFDLASGKGAAGQRDRVDSSKGGHRSSVR